MNVLSFVSTWTKLDEITNKTKNVFFAISKTQSLKLNKEKIYVKGSAQRACRCFKASTGNRTYLWESDAFTSSTVVVVKLTNLAKSFRDISLSWYTFVDICIHFCSLKATIHQILNQGIRSRLSWHLIAIPPSKLQLVVLFDYTLFYFHMQNYNPMIAIKWMGFLPVVLSFPV